MDISPRPYSFNNPDGIYFVTFTVVFWIDVFTRKVYKDILVESIQYCIKKKGLNVHAWVIMSNRVHLIISAKDSEKVILSDVLRDLKKFTSRRIVEAIKEENESRKEWMLDKFLYAGKRNLRNKSYQFWQQNNHCVELTSDKFIQQKLNYVHNNPVKEGWVGEAEEYCYSSALDYVMVRDLLKLALFDFKTCGSLNADQEIGSPGMLRALR